MQGIILGAGVSPNTAEILSRLWIAGVIPFLVGMALIINGMFVSKKLAEVVKQATEPSIRTPEIDTNPLELRSAKTTPFIPSSYSVTENTTEHLGIDGQNQN
jgi:hypothetical protein